MLPARRPLYPCLRDPISPYIPLVYTTIVRADPCSVDCLIFTKNIARYWKDPHKFDPSRFLGDWNKDAFMPFSAGPRACLGRRFNETESIAVLTLMTLNYKIGVLEEPQFAHETQSQRAERILRSKPAVTMT